MATSLGTNAFAVTRVYCTSVVFCFILKVVKDDDTKSVVSEDDPVFSDSPRDTKGMDKRKEHLVRVWTKKKKPKKTGTLSQNFVNNFRYTIIEPP